MPDYSLTDLELLDAPAEFSFDNLTLLATSLLHAPVSLFSIIDSERDRQFFKSQLGLAEPLASERQTPLSHSFCRHVVEQDGMLVVNDSRSHPLVAGNPSIEELGVAAYLGAPVHDGTGRPVGALCVVDSHARDWSPTDVDHLARLAACVTDAVGMKSMLARERTLGQNQRDFTYAIAHDLQAPLNTVRLVLNELAARREAVTPADDDVPELHAMARHTLDAADTLIEDVLVYAGAAAGEFEPETIDLTKLVEDLAASLAADIRGANAELVFAKLPPVSGQPSQIRMLVQNLISNALKFTRPDVHPRVGIEASVEGNTVRLAVSDNGIGIAPGNQARIFRMFDRLHVDREFKGSGIGLALCERVARNHGGRITVDSSPGHGATFTVTLPSAAAASDCVPDSVSDSAPPELGSSDVPASDEVPSDVVSSDIPSPNGRKAA